MLKQFRSVLVASLLAGAACFFLGSGTSSAATIDVAAGTDAINDNAICQLSEAIENINDAAQTHDDCIETGTYGTNDTITLPTGTITLTADLPGITQSVTIQGQGMDVSVIDGGGAWDTFALTGSVSQLSDFTVTSFTDTGISITSPDLTIERVEIDGNGAVEDATGSLFGLIMLYDYQVTATVGLRDVYVHDIAAAPDGPGAVAGVFIGASQDAAVAMNVDRLTVARLRNTSDQQTNVVGFNFVSGLTDGSFTPSSISITMRNATFNDIVADSAGAGAIGGLAAVNGGETNVELGLENITSSAIQGLTNPLPVSSPTTTIGIGGAAVQPSDQVNVDLTATNVLFTDALNSQTNVSSHCGLFDATSAFGGTGTVTANITSTGGNLTDDTSCSSYFTHPTDQNNVAALAASLSPLADNGGSVPTMALLEGSPAIDAGITIPSLTTDARLAPRPQGSAYDSGAYESPYTKPPTPTDEGEGLAESGVMIVGVLVFAALVVGGAVLTLKSPKKPSRKVRKP